MSDPFHEVDVDAEAAPRDAPTRRRVVGWGVAAAAATGAGWTWALSPAGTVVRQEGATTEAYAPALFSPEELEAVACLAEALIPRTDTPGARDARVHEYLDLSLSVAEEPERRRFREGLAWTDARGRARFGAGLHEAGTEQVASLLREISDDHETPSAELEPGRRFFADLKRRTIFGYYTSLEGRTELGLPEAVTFQRFRGCPHGGDH